MKFELIIEAKGKELWGRVRHGGDLLTAIGHSNEELIKDFENQLRNFYKMTEPLDFEIKYDLRKGKDATI